VGRAVPRTHTRCGDSAWAILGPSGAAYCERRSPRSWNLGPSHQRQSSGFKRRKTASHAFLRLKKRIAKYEARCRGGDSKASSSAVSMMADRRSFADETIIRYRAARRRGDSWKKWVI